MDLLRKQVNLPEVLIAKEVTVDCSFVLNGLYRMVVYADCCGEGFLCCSSDRQKQNEEDLEITATAPCGLE